MSKLEGLNRILRPKHLYYGPRWLVLGVNNICNLHCKMCDVGTQNLETNFAQNLVGTHPLHMPMELFRRLVDQTKTHFPNCKLGYAFTEPLIYKHLDESLGYAHSKGLFTSITTNALNLRQKAVGLVENGLDELYISLDGPQDIHNEIRGHKSSYQRALEGIEALQSLSNIPISIFCVITEWNISYLKQFVCELSKFKLKQVGFLHSNFITESTAHNHNQQFGNLFNATHSNVEEIDFSAYSLEALFHELEEIKTINFPFPVTFHPKMDTLEEVKNYYLNPEIKIGKKCLDVFYNLMIKSDGSVIPAHGRCFNVSVGNLYETDLNSIWNAEKLGQLRSTLNKNNGLLTACTRCCSAVK
jgi:MoaA/NifB/PqqE/SkfB family radical SAM enzyme